MGGRGDGHAPRARGARHRSGSKAAELSETTANDLVLAVRASDEPALAGSAGSGRGRKPSRSATRPATTTLPSGRPPALPRRPGGTRDVNVAIVSVPGEYAALEAHHALTAGLHVLLFSDGVPLEEEIELKERAAETRAAW